MTVTKHTNEDLMYKDGMIYTVSGTSIARMDRGEPYTRPTERDANAKRFVRIWNLWPEIEEFLESFLAIGGLRSSPEAREAIRIMLRRMGEEVP